MKVPKLLLRISAGKGQVPRSADLPLQELPYAVLGLVRSCPFPCNYSSRRRRSWTTLHPHPIHRVHLLLRYSTKDLVITPPHFPSSNSSLIVLPPALPAPPLALFLFLIPLPYLYNNNNNNNKLSHLQSHNYYSTSSAPSSKPSNPKYSHNDHHTLQNLKNLHTTKPDRNSDKTSTTTTKIYNLRKRRDAKISIPVPFWSLLHFNFFFFSVQRLQDFKNCDQAGLFTTTAQNEGENKKL